MLARRHHPRLGPTLAGLISAIVIGLLTPVSANATTSPSRSLEDSPAPVLTVSTHTPKVARYQRFTYQTGAIPGLSGPVAKEVQKRIDGMVDRVVAGARKPSRTSCPVGSDPCGIFQQSLRTYSCSAGSLCVAQDVGLLLPGMNSGQEWVDTLVLDSATGKPRPLSAYVPRRAMPAFLAATTAAVRGHLATDGLSADPFWNTPILRRQIKAWIPTRAGMRIWFDKYSAGPGAMGVIQVLVPWVPGSGPVPR